MVKVEELKNYHISKAYFKTKKKHSNRPNELSFINVDIEKNTKESVQGVEIILDKEHLGMVPYSTETHIFRDGNNFSIHFIIDKPENIDNIPFRYQMKLYPLFGTIYKIENGNSSNEVYKK